MDVYFENEKYEFKLILEEENKKLFETDSICPITGSLLSDIKDNFKTYDSNEYSIGNTYLIEIDGVVKNYE